MILALLFVFAPAQPARAADSFASVILTAPTVTSASDSQLNSPTPATASLLGLATGNAKSIVSTGSVGVEIDVLTGAPIGSYSAGANWHDTWIGSGSGSTTAGVTLTLTGQVSTSLLTHYAGFWELSFDYALNGTNYLHFAASGDNGAMSYGANAKGTDISSLVIWTPSTINPLLTDFSLSYNGTAVICAVCPVTATVFSDEMYASILVDGDGPITLDAFHTFHAELKSLNPSVTFTNEAGRSVAAIPEPQTYAMLLAGLGLLGFAVRRSKHKEAAAT